MSFSRSEWLRQQGDDGDDEEDILDQNVHDRPDAICYLIEVSPSMLKAAEYEDEGGITRYRSSVSTALRSALDLMRTRIISGSSRDVVGVVLYDTAESLGLDGETARDGLFLVLEPAGIRAMNIKKLSDLLEDLEYASDSAYKHFNPRDTEIKSSVLIEGMRFSENLLKNRSSLTANRQLYILTDNDDPFQGNRQQQSVACVFSNDAHEAGFQIKTLFIPEHRANFDLSRFWNRFRFDPSIDAEMDNASMVFSGSSRFDKLLSLSSEAGKTRRAQFQIPLFLFNGIALSVTGYGAVNEQRKKPPVQVEQAEEIREVYHKTVYTESATGESLNPKDDIVKYASIGAKDSNEQRVFFDNTEMLKIKTLGMKPSLKLLGFIPQAQMKPQHINKHSYLIYPNELLYVNSVPAFSALLKSMVKKDVIGLAVLIARVNATPQIVYMMPQSEVRDAETDVQVEPPCIWLVQVPFADDIRPPTTEVCLSALETKDDAESPHPDSTQLVSLWRRLIKKLKVIYQPNQFANPVLQYHYANLEAIALSLPEPKADDQTHPDTEAIAKRVGSIVKEIKTAVEQHSRLNDDSWLQLDDKAATIKGYTGDNGEEDGPPASKKVKVSKERAVQGIAVLENQLTEAFKKNNNMKGITNDVLKDYLKQKNVKQTSAKKKAELLELAKEQLSNDGKL